MDEGIMVKVLLLTLGLLFIVFQYFEIPFFGAIFLLTVFLILALCHPDFLLKHEINSLFLPSPKRF